METSMRMAGMIATVLAGLGCGTSSSFESQGTAADGSVQADVDVPGDAAFDSDSAAPPSDADGTMLDVYRADADFEGTIVVPDPESCGPVATVTAHVSVTVGEKPVIAPGVSHCADGRFYATFETHSDGKAWVDVPAGGWVTVATLDSYSHEEALHSVGGVEMGDQIRFDANPRPPSPPDLGPGLREVQVQTIDGAVTYEVVAGARVARGDGTSPIEIDADGTEIVGYALDADDQRFSASLPLQVPSWGPVIMGPFEYDVRPTVVRLANPAQGPQTYTAALILGAEDLPQETQRTTVTLPPGAQSGFESAHAHGVFKKSVMSVEAENDRSMVFGLLSTPIQEDGIRYDIDLSQDLLPFLDHLSLAPGGRPIIDVQWAGPMFCSAGPADGLVIHLRGYYPDGTFRWNLVAPPRTSFPLQLPELSGAMSGLWPPEAAGDTSVSTRFVAFSERNYRDVRERWFDHGSDLGERECSSFRDLFLESE